MLVRLFSPTGGAVMALARSLRKSTSKLAASLQPADELEVQLARGRGARSVLIGVRTVKEHSTWRTDLNLLSFYWYMAECVYTSAGEPEINSALYRLVVNLLRSDPPPAARCSAAAVFALKFQVVHGLLADLTRCAIDGHVLGADEPVHLLPSGEGLIGREAYNRHYARTAGALVRLAPERLERWRRLLAGALLDYPQIAADKTDAALLLYHSSRLLGDTAGHAVNSAEYLRRQWKLPTYSEILQSQS